MTAKGVSRVGRSAWAYDFWLSGSPSCSFLDGFSIGFPMDRGSRRHWVWDWMVRHGVVPSRWGTRGQDRRRRCLGEVRVPKRHCKPPGPPGMCLLGDQNVFLSLLPRFPHRSLGNRCGAALPELCSPGKFKDPSLPESWQPICPPTPPRRPLPGQTTSCCPLPLRHPWMDTPPLKLLFLPEYGSQGEVSLEGAGGGAPMTLRFPSPYCCPPPSIFPPFLQVKVQHESVWPPGTHKGRMTAIPVCLELSPFLPGKPHVPETPQSQASGGNWRLMPSLSFPRRGPLFLLCSGRPDHGGRKGTGPSQTALHWRVPGLQSAGLPPWTPTAASSHTSPTRPSSFLVMATGWLEPLE